MEQGAGLPDVVLLLPAVVGASVVDPAVGLPADDDVAVPLDGSVGEDRSDGAPETVEAVAEASPTEPWKEQPHRHTAASSTPPARTDPDVTPPR